MNIQTILDKLAAPDIVSENDRQLILEAYELAQAAHKGQTRTSGEPYIQHCLEVADLLADFRLDPLTIAAGLLHDVVEDSLVKVADLERHFGQEVAQLVDGVTKLSKIDLSEIGQLSPDEQQMENLRKMFLAMSRDVRVVLVKLADRLHNMRTLEPLSEDQRKRIAEETLEIFAPVANRLGIGQWQWELEDLSFRHLQSGHYHKIAKLVAEQRTFREREIQRHIEVLHQRLTQEGIPIVGISGRLKHIYGIYRKIEKLGIPLEYIHDTEQINELIHDSAGIRVITQTVADCYHTLGIIHGLWRPISDKFHDYIADPKNNLYQSLHTTVVGNNGRHLEVQIRTWEMHRTAEYGIAAHWRYKEGGKRDPVFEAKIAWLRSLMEWWQEVTDAGEFVEAMKTDIFQDRVYAFTPQGKLIDLPVGATPLDFAYHVHTEIGHHCRGARVNGKLVSLDYQLKNGDQVEILTTRRGGPSRDWLNPALGYVKTNRARNKIRQWFRHQDREQSIAQGREIVERELRRLGLEKLSHETVARLFNYEKIADFYAAVGFGDIHTQQIVSKIAETRSREEEEKLPLTPLPPVSTVEDIQVQGTGGLLTHLARCCHPLPGDDIIGYVTRGRGVTVHRHECPNILRLNDQERLIEVSWGTHPQTAPATIQITAYDRTRLISEISNIIGAEDINIAAVNQEVRKNIATIYITIQVNNMAQLSRVLTKIERLPNVIEAHRHIG